MKGFERKRPLGARPKKVSLMVRKKDWDCWEGEKSRLRLRAGKRKGEEIRLPSGAAGSAGKEIGGDALIGEGVKGSPYVERRTCVFLSRAEILVQKKKQRNKSAVALA